MIMGINRFNLVHAISLARKNKDYKTYDELLDIFYMLLEQEEIKRNFITEFNTYNKVSESAEKLLTKSIATYF